MDTSTITRTHHVTESVDENGELVDVTSTTEPRYGCTACGTSWGADQWTDVAIHCLTQHSEAPEPAAAA
jgi:hypothetical protein